MFNERLKSARKMAGMSLEQLAKEMGNITKQALSNYENGKREPNSSVIISLAKSLQVRPEYFFQKHTISLKEFEYRKKSGLRTKEMAELEEKAKDIITRYLEIEKILGLDSNWINPVKNESIKSADDVERAANLLRNEWNLGKDAISGLIETVESNGIKVVFVDANNKFDGLANFTENIPIIMLNQNIKDIARLRFTLSHELGHIVLNLSQISDLKEKENLCHVFAGAFLIPKEQIIKEIGGTRRTQIALQELISIKEEYGISIQAIEKRLHHLQIINDNDYKRFNILVNKKGWRKSEPGKYERNEEPVRFKNLVYRALAEEIITIGKAASLLNTTISEIYNETEMVI